MELSIVLVILGLLVGGVLGGSALIRAAELRKVESEYNTFTTAINLFKQKYHALPGDMRNATEIWGRADNGAFSGQCGDPKSDQGTGKQTCNGNGNKLVGSWANLNDYYEAFRFWQHLSNSGFLQESYTGVHGPDGQYDHVTGVNSPASDYAGAGWAVEEVSYFGGDPGYFAIDYGNYLEFGSKVPGNCNGGPIFTPAEVAAWDAKLDDGKPGRGKMVVIWWDDCTTAANDRDLDAEYDLLNDGNDCAVAFVHAF